jgi:hypothetical protein
MCEAATCCNSRACAWGLCCSLTWQVRCQLSLEPIAWPFLEHVCQIVALQPVFCVLCSSLRFLASGKRLPDVAWSRCL